MSEADSDTTTGENGRLRTPTAGVRAIQREAAAYAKRNPGQRPKWTQYRTEQQERIVADAALTRRNLRAQARKLGFRGPSAVDDMLNAWLPNALEVMTNVDDGIAIEIGKVLERIAVALEKMTAGPGLPAQHAIPLPDWKCPVHGTSKLIPAGLYKSGPKTGQPRDAFVSCGIQKPDGQWCDERPTRTAVVVSPAPVSETLP